MSEYNDQFIKTNFSLLTNKEFLIKNRCKYTLYLLARKSIIREPYDGDLNLYKNFWKKGYLAASRSVRYLAKQFGYSNSNSSVRTWIKELENDKTIILRSVKVGAGRPQNIFVFGVHNGMMGDDYREYFYIDMPELINVCGVDTIVDFYKIQKIRELNSQKLALSKSPKLALSKSQKLAHRIEKS